MVVGHILRALGRVPASYFVFPVLRLFHTLHQTLSLQLLVLCLVFWDLFLRLLLPASLVAS